MTKVTQSKRKTKTGTKRGRPSKLDKLERMVKGLTDENEYLHSLFNRMHDACENTTQMHKKDAEDWKSIANEWQGLYYSLKDILHEDGLTPEFYTTRSELAIRFMSKYRMN